MEELIPIAEEMCPMAPFCITAGRYVIRIAAKTQAALSEASNELPDTPAEMEVPTPGQLEAADAIDAISTSFTEGLAGLSRYESKRCVVCPLTAAVHQVQQ